MNTSNTLESLASPIGFSNSTSQDYPVTCIVGWKPSRDQLIQAGHPSLPTLPPGKSFLLGCDLLEWRHLKCKANNLYIVTDNDFLFEIPERCFDQQVAAYRPDSAQIFLSGFCMVMGQQEPPPDQTVLKTFKSQVLERDDHTVLNDAYGGGENMLAGDINRAFDLLGWNPATPCVCGIAYPNNCAHYLSNALIRAGFPEPSGGSNQKCPRGRLIRALDVLEWCKANKLEFSSDHNSLSYGTWIVFQQRSGGVQHVCIHKERAADYSRAGTGDYPDWPTQWHYRF